MTKCVYGIWNNGLGGRMYSIQLYPYLTPGKCLQMFYFVKRVWQASERSGFIIVASDLA